MATRGWFLRKATLLPNNASIRNTGGWRNQPDKGMMKLQIKWDKISSLNKISKCVCVCVSEVP